MSYYNYHTKLPELRSIEEQIYQKSIEVITSSATLSLHMHLVTCAMDVLDRLRQYPTNDQDLKVIQVLGMRAFNAFASSTKLVLSGYNQTGAMIMRDILETVFLVDFFQTNRSAITKWREADRKTRKKEFNPGKIRDALDIRDGAISKLREQKYKLYSELAAHASMESIVMLRPNDGDIHMGPFLDIKTLEASAFELGELAVQVGEAFGLFCPTDWEGGIHIFGSLKMEWYRTFRPSILEARAPKSASV